jgi:predicted aspartyl protease/Flp pilus assembly protein TadD
MKYSRIAGPVALIVSALGASLAVSAQAPQNRPLNAEAQLTRGDQMFASRRYEEAFDAYDSARVAERPGTRIQAGAGQVRTLLRMSMFADAARMGAAVAARDPQHPMALAVHGDSLWAAGLFDEAERRYDEALALNPNQPLAVHGRGRALATRRQFDEALALVKQAVDSDDENPEFHYTLAGIYEELRDFREASRALDRYRDTVPSRDMDDLTSWAQAQSDFLRSFGDKQPYELLSGDRVYTVPLTIEEDGRVKVRGRLNNREDIDFVLDTGADRTTLTPAIASRAGVVPVMTLQTAGVGAVGVGYRGLQVARVDEIQVGDFRMAQIGALIKSPSMPGLPRPEGAGFSPLSMGLSIEVDYEAKTLTMGNLLPEGDFPIRLPMRMQRLPFVRGTLNDSMPVNLAIDTGGTAISLSRRVASRLETPTARLVPVKVYGTSGWDPTAFLLPYVDLTVAPGVGSSQRSVAVLNLDAPSALLGFELGGILGHEFLSRYLVRIDLVRGFVGLRPRT